MRPPPPGMSYRAPRMQCCLLHTKNVPPNLEIRGSVNTGTSLLSVHFAALAALEGEQIMPVYKKPFIKSPAEMVCFYFHLRRRWAVFSEYGFISVSPHSLSLMPNADAETSRLVSPRIPSNIKFHGHPRDPRNLGAHSGVWSACPATVPS